MSSKKILNSEIIKKELGSRIRSIMEKKSVKQTDLAEKTGIPKSTLNEIINSNKEPSVYKIFAIAKYFDVSIEWLLTGNGQDKNGNGFRRETDKIIFDNFMTHFTRMINGNPELLNKLIEKHVEEK